MYENNNRKDSTSKVKACSTMFGNFQCTMVVSVFGESWTFDKRFHCM